MHGFIRDRLEDLLGAERLRAELVPGIREFRKHVSSCAECAGDVDAMKTHSELLKTLRAPVEVEPQAGFYARVMQRIEERAKESIWASLIYSPWSPRIAYVSLTLAVVLGGFVIASESRDGHLSGHGQMIAQTAHYDAPVIGDASQQRDAVLENFAVH